MSALARHRIPISVLDAQAEQPAKSEHYLYVGISYKFILARVFDSHACTQITINTFINNLVFFTVITI